MNKGGLGVDHNPPADRANFAAHRHAEPSLRATGAAETGEFALIPGGDLLAEKTAQGQVVFVPGAVGQVPAVSFPEPGQRLALTTGKRQIEALRRPAAAATISHAKSYVIGQGHARWRSGVIANFWWKAIDQAATVTG